LTTARGIPTLLNGAEKDHVQAVGRVRALRLLKVLVAEVLFATKGAAENNVHVVIKLKTMYYIRLRIEN
jgi:hypothetical protein